MTYAMIETDFIPVTKIAVGDVIQLQGGKHATVADYWNVYMKRHGEAVDLRECTRLIRVRYRDDKGKDNWKDYGPESGVYKILG